MASPSGSTQSESTSTVVRPPDCTTASVVRTWTGGEFSPSARTVTVDRGGRGAAAAVGDRVRETHRPGRARRQRELDLLALVDEVDPADRLVDRREALDHEHIAVRVVVVEQHRQHGRPAGPRAELSHRWQPAAAAPVSISGGVVSSFSCCCSGCSSSTMRSSQFAMSSPGALHRPRVAGPAVVQHGLAAVHHEGELGRRRSSSRGRAASPAPSSQRRQPAPPAQAANSQPPSTAGAAGAPRALVHAARPASPPPSGTLSRPSVWAMQHRVAGEARLLQYRGRCRSRGARRGPPPGRPGTAARWCCPAPPNGPRPR